VIDTPLHLNAVMFQAEAQLINRARKREIAATKRRSDRGFKVFTRAGDPISAVLATVGSNFHLLLRCLTLLFCKFLIALRPSAQFNPS
jgi:hypothetical protein